MSMDSNTHQNYPQNQQPNSGLLRFRSAPSSLIANFNETVDCGVTKGSFESERLMSRFMSSSGGNGDVGSHSFRDFDDKSPVTTTEEAAVTYSTSQQSYSVWPPHYPKQSNAGISSAMDSSYELLAIDHQSQGKSISSNLIRQSSSPAGLFANVLAQNGYATMKGVDNYGGANGADGEVSPSANRLKSHYSFSSRLPSSLGMLSQISEIGSESIGASGHDDGKLGNGTGGARFYNPGFPSGGWHNSLSFTENFSGLKREQDNDGKLYSSAQDGESGNRIHMLSHSLSLPKASTEMVIEKFLQFQDSVPCKIRAKRGCATHPRSIAERVRRTRISERMRKLQELVPNMDKQTSTADMLDLAVEYIKDLQKQFKTLSDNRANCKCLNTQKPVPNQIV